MEKVNAPGYGKRFAALNNLAGGSRLRLAELRRSAAKLAANVNRNMHVAANPDWRTVRHSGFASRFPDACPGFNAGPCGKKIPILSSHGGPKALPIRGWEYADECRSASGINHRGWYTNTDCSEKARGFVAMISHGRYLAGYEWSANGEWVLFCDQTYSDESEAASAADSLAESFADDAREDSERWDRMTQAESEAEEAAQTLAGLWPGRNASEWLREQTREAIEKLREARAELREATEDYEKGGN